jgi:hypothetical protein
MGIKVKNMDSQSSRNSNNSTIIDKNEDFDARLATETTVGNNNTFN